MALKLFNTLSKELDEFKPVREDAVRMYNCGPTVYNYVHIGNLRSYVFADVLRRYLEYTGYIVKQVVNITDVGHLTSDADEGEDKMLVAAKKEKKGPWEISKFYAEKYFEDLDKLNIRKAMMYPKATDHIKEMIEVIKVLEKRGYAYAAGGNVYFDTSKFEEYGKLSKFNIQELESGKRVSEDKNKRNFSDFVLWFTKSKYEGHIMKWDSPWNEGYPGWHIECTAMSMKYLSDAFGKKFDPKKFETIDIHTGGEDNMFPHHECEIAQTEAATGKKFSTFWMHIKHLIVEGKKMSKSSGNFYTLKDILGKGYDPMAVRYVLMSTHYRQQLNFTFDGLDAGKKSVEKMRDFMRRLKDMHGKDDADKAIEAAVEKFENAMDDDLNISVALAAVFDFMNEVNKLELSKDEAKRAYGTMLKFDSVLGLKLEFKEEKLDAEIDGLVKQREEARKRKDWKTSDEIRDKLKSMGIVLEDTGSGIRWKRS